MDDLLDLAKLARMDERCEVSSILTLSHLENYITFIRDADFINHPKPSETCDFFKVKLPHTFPIMYFLLTRYDKTKYDWEFKCNGTGFHRNQEGLFNSLDAAIDDMYTTMDVVIFP